MRKLFDYKRKGIVVMEGKRVVAKARYHPNFNCWTMRFVGGCWIDTMTNEVQKAHYKKLGLPPNCAPDLKKVNTKREVMEHMRSFLND